MTKAIAFLRVSKSSQVTKRQKDEIKSFAKKNSIDIVQWIERKVSGSRVKDYRQVIFEAAISKKVDFVIFQEVTRIGRNMKEVQILKDDLHQNNIGFIISSQSLQTIKNGSIDPTQNMIVNQLITQAVYESDLMSVRIRSGLKASKNKSGRPSGTKESISDRLNKPKNKKIVNYLKQGCSVYKTHLLTKSSISQVQRIKKLLQEAEQSPTSKRNEDRLKAFLKSRHDG